MNYVILIFTLLFWGERLFSLRTSFKYAESARNSSKNIYESNAKAVRKMKKQYSEQYFCRAKIVYCGLQVLLETIIPVIYYVVTARYIGSSFIGILSAVQIILSFFSLKHVAFSEQPSDYEISWMYKYFNSVTDLIYYPFVLYFIVSMSAHFM